MKILQKTNVKSLWLKAKLYVQMCIGFAFAAMCSTTAKADLTNPDKVTIKSNANADDVFGKSIGFIFELAKYGGAVLFAWGLVKLIMAVINDQPDQIKTGAFMMGGGLALFFLRTISANMGIISK